jgi:hypothetical protein
MSLKAGKYRASGGVKYVGAFGFYAGGLDLHGIQDFEEYFRAPICLL